MTASTLPSTISAPNCWSPPKGPDFNFVIVLDRLTFFFLDISKLLCKNGSDVKIWCHSPETAKDINTNHTNSKFLSDIKLPESLQATIDLIEIVKSCRILVSTVPSHVTRKIAKIINPNITTNHFLVILSKGIEENSLALLSEIFMEELDTLPKIAVISGPTFAIEVAMELPSAALLACDDNNTKIILQKIFHSDRFRLYLSNDMIGAQIGGAIKNVVVIATAVVLFGLSSGAALATVVGVLIEVPLMLALVYICKRTCHLF